MYQNLENWKVLYMVSRTSYQIVTIKEALQNHYLLVLFGEYSLESMNQTWYKTVSLIGKMEGILNLREVL